MSEEKKVKAVLVELTQNDRKDNGNVVKGETRRYWYHAEEYPLEVFDPGRYWEVCTNSCLWPATPDGVNVIDDRGTLCDWLELSGDGFVDEALALEPGQWVEHEFPGWYHTGCRVRATAYGELPPLSAEQTVKASDLSHKAMTRIRINGKPLYAPGTMENGSQAWFPDLYEFALDAILGAVREKGGATADVSFSVGKPVLSVRDGETAFSFELRARSREGLVEFLRNLGVPNPETVRVTKTVGDASGVTCVYTLFTGSDQVGG